MLPKISLYAVALFVLSAWACSPANAHQNDRPVEGSGDSWSNFTPVSTNHRDEHCTAGSKPRTPPTQSGVSTSTPTGEGRRYTGPRPSGQLTAGLQQTDVSGSYPPGDNLSTTYIDVLEALYPSQHQEIDGSCAAVSQIPTPKPAGMSATAERWIMNYLRSTQIGKLMPRQKPCRPVVKPVLTMIGPCEFASRLLLESGAGGVPGVQVANLGPEGSRGVTPLRQRGGDITLHMGGDVHGTVTPSSAGVQHPGKHGSIPLRGTIIGTLGSRRKPMLQAKGPPAPQHNTKSPTGYKWLKPGTAMCPPPPPPPTCYMQSHPRS